MGFFDKVFGGKTAAGKSSDDLREFRTHVVREKGFSIAVPADWSSIESPVAFEACPRESSRIRDPGSGREIVSPAVAVTVQEIPDPRQNMVKETLRARSVELAGHRLVKHIAGEVKNADHGIVYEYRYGPDEAPIHALGMVAQKKGRLFIVSACGAEPDFDRNRGALEAVIASFRLL